MNIAFIGLGNMGSAMATNLIKAGHTLTVYNRTRARADALKPLGARVASTPGEAAAGAEVAITMLADDHALESVVFNKGNILESLPPNAIHVSMSTISVALSRRLAAAHAERKQHYVCRSGLWTPGSRGRRKALCCRSRTRRADRALPSAV